MTNIPYSKTLPVLDPERTVHVAVHVQNYFFKPASPSPSEERRQPLADRAVENISGLAELLHKERIPTCWAVMENEDVCEELGQLCDGITPREGDFIAGDNERSAIQTAGLLETLRRAGIETLLVSGGYASECVTDTVNDALEAGFKVAVITDCLADNSDELYLGGMANSECLREGRLLFTDRKTLEQNLTAAHQKQARPQAASPAYEAPSPF